MSKKSLITLVFTIVISSTFSYVMYDIITVYSREKFLDDISMGLFGVFFRISLLLPIIIAEISIFFDVINFASKRMCKMDFIFILHIISCSISIVVIVFSTICYMGSTNEFIQILLLSSIIALLSVKAICGLLKITHREATNKK